LPAATPSPAAKIAALQPQARRIVLANLTPGTTYMIQAQAIGGSTGQSGWSNPVGIMST
jgi:hypothetical protein